MRTNRAIFLVTAAAFIILFPIKNRGAIFFSDSFGYSDGNLVSQGGWSATSGAGVNAVQVSNGHGVLTSTSGEDVAHALDSSIAPTAGTSFYVGLTLNVVSAQGSGDYFVHLLAGSTQYGSLYAKNSGSGFVLGLSPDHSTAVYGSTVLSFNTSYRIVFRYNFVSGPDNDTMAVYVDPGQTEPGGSYASATSTATTPADPGSALGSIGFRQGSTTPTLTFDDLVVTDTFIETVPEPTNLALGIFAFVFVAARGVRAWCAFRRGEQTLLVCD